jgi:hypothetical protein
MSFVKATTFAFAALLALPAEAQSVDLPTEAQSVVDEFDKAAAVIRDRAEAEINGLRKKAVQRLKPLQDKYCQAAKLDEAVAIRDAILEVGAIKKDPGIFSPTKEDVGRILYFEVVGDNVGPVWGTKVYCTGSDLSASAVHAGALRSGEKGIVKVRVLSGAESYHGSVQNNVTSSGYGPYAPAFTIERVE